MVPGVEKDATSWPIEQSESKHYRLFACKVKVFDTNSGKRVELNVNMTDGADARENTKLIKLQNIGEQSSRSHTKA